MTIYSIKTIFAGKVAVDANVIVRGWVRTRRDSKAGISFLQIYDGSCFNPIQAVIPSNLPNYNSDILKLTAGCAVVVGGKLVPSQGKGQEYEIQAESVEVVGWVDDPDTYPISPKHHTLEYLREVAHLRAMALGLQVSPHGECYFCPGGRRHSAAVESAQRIISKEINVGEWTSPRMLLPILDNRSPIPGGGCGGCGAQSFL